MINDRNKDFESVEIPDLWADGQEKRSFRLTGAQMAAMPSEKKDIGVLRCRLAELFDTHFSSYAQLESMCDIKPDTFQKVLRFKNGRNVTYQLLAKFCVGAQLSEGEAKELFALMGHDLRENSRYDYILLCELRNRISANMMKIYNPLDIPAYSQKRTDCPEVSYISRYNRLIKRKG